MSRHASFSLCQPDSGKSCAACCGLYNYADNSRSVLTERLQRRTARFRAEVREAADLEAFSRAIRREEDQRRLFSVIHCCEFVGFLDHGALQVGCLLHPAQNGGLDLREVSFYGQDLCAGHRCPSDHFLTPAEKQVLVELLEDWYLYGLCLTDIDLVKQFFRHLADRLGEEPAPERFRQAALRNAAQTFFTFKTHWPYRTPEANRFGRFYFDGNQYLICPIDYGALGCERSRFDGVFQSLASRFSSREELQAAERKIAEAIEACAAAYEERPDFR